MKALVVALIIASLPSCKSTPTEEERNAAQLRLEELALNLGVVDYKLREAATPGLAMEAKNSIQKYEAQVATIIAEGKIPKTDADKIVDMNRKRMLASYEEGMKLNRKFIESLD